MTALPVFRQLHRRDFKDADAAIEAVMLAFNQLQGEVLNWMGAQPQRTLRRGVNFTTDSDGKASVKVATGLDRPADFVTVSMVKKGGGSIGSQWGWSVDFVNSGSFVVLNFQDLPVSIDVVATVAVE